VKQQFTNGMQFKAYVKKLAKENDVTAQLILQEIMLDELLERLSVSTYKNNMVLKGGFLIASLIGVDTRSTMDLDTTLVGYPLSLKSITNAFTDICSIEVDNDQIEMTVVNVEPIRKDDEYGGYRVHIDAVILDVQTVIKVDVSTGDKMTPKEIHYKHKLITEDRKIPILAYNLETVLAEKLESIVARGNANTRAKDFYDVYQLNKLEQQNIDFPLLKKAILRTAEKRKTTSFLTDYSSRLDSVKETPVLIRLWKRYGEDHDYAEGIDFVDTVDAAKELLDFTKISM